MTDSERIQLKAQHRQERDGRVRDRIKAILLYNKHWLSQALVISSTGYLKHWLSQAIAEALLISDQAVRNHIEDYKTPNSRP